MPEKDLRICLSRYPYSLECFGSQAISTYTLIYHFTSTENFKGEFLLKFRHFHSNMSLAISSLNPWLVFIIELLT